MSGIMDLMKVHFVPHYHSLDQHFCVCVCVCEHSVNQCMDLRVQNMYEEGDEDMKRTIAKAWTDARSGKTTDSLSGLR